MRNLNYLFLIALVIFSFSCSSEDEEPKLVGKNVTIEVEMEGNYTDYLVTFSVHSMLSGTSTFVAPVLDQPIELKLSQDATQLQLAVMDHGIGVPVAERDHLFERFYRAAPAGVSGSGLGLAIVKEIASQQGAQVSLQSPVADGRGTAIRLSWPLA